MKKIFALTLGIAIICLCAYAPFPPDTGEVIVDGVYEEEVNTNPPPHEEGDREFPEGYEEGYIQHQVKQDDTLWKIAGEYHVDFEEVLELNTHLIDPNLIYPDDLINLPNHQVQGVQEAYFTY